MVISPTSMVIHRELWTDVRTAKTARVSPRGRGCQSQAFAQPGGCCASDQWGPAAVCDLVCLAATGDGIPAPCIAGWVLARTAGRGCGATGGLGPRRAGDGGEVAAPRLGSEVGLSGTGLDARAGSRHAKAPDH